HNTFNNKNKGVSPSLVIHQATEYPIIIEKKGNGKNNKITIEVNWKPPDSNTFKLNVDGFVKRNPGPEGLTGVIRVHHGNWVVGFTEHTPLTNPIRAELQAMRRGVALAVEYRLSPLEINSNSLEAIKMLTKNNLIYNDLIVECRFLMTKLEVTKAEHVFREQNRVADKPSKEGVKNVLFDEPNFLTTATICMQKEVDADMLGTKFTRVRK
ncbi:hypothetical protein MTR67_035834, partial [Solanum verrucosum]